MTLPNGLIHHWDPSVDQGGDLLKDTIGGVHGVLGRQVVGTYFDPKLEQEVRLVPDGISHATHRQFAANNENGWSDGGSRSYTGLILEARSPQFAEFFTPAVMPAGVRTTQATSPVFSGTGEKWIYVDFWFQWKWLKFPPSGIVKILALRSGGADKLWWGLEPVRDALGVLDSRYNDQHDLEQYGCLYLPDDTKLARNQNLIVQHVKWEINRIQVLAKLGTTDGEAHLYINDLLVSSLTGLDLGAESEWDQVQIATTWGQAGDGNYDGQVDDLRCQHIWVGTGDTATWPRRALHPNEPTSFTKLAQCTYDGADPGIGWTEDHKATVLSPGYFGYTRNYPWPTISEYASPLIFYKRPQERFGNGAQRIQHRATSGTGNPSFSGIWYAGDQLGWISGYQTSILHCHTNEFKEVYSVTYVRFGDDLIIGGPSGEIERPIVLGYDHKNTVFTYSGKTVLGVYLDTDTLDTPGTQLYLQLWDAAGIGVGVGNAVGTRIAIERDRIYKIELWGRVTASGTSEPTAHIAKWWLDEVLQYDGAVPVEVFQTAVQGVFDNNYSCVRYAYWAVEEFPSAGFVDYYYLYASGPDDQFTASPPLGKKEWKSPDWVGGPPAYLSFNEGTQMVDYFGLEHVKIPIDNKDGFWVGEDRNDYALMMVVDCKDTTPDDQYILDSWLAPFNYAIPSVVWSGSGTLPYSMRAKGQMFGALGGEDQKIQINWDGQTWITVADTPSIATPHTFTIVSRRYTAQRLEFYLDGVLVHERDWDHELDGRWFANRGNNIARSGIETHGDVTFFGDVTGGGRSIPPWGDIGSGTDCANEFRGGFKGQGGSVLMWDRPLMPEEVKVAHEHLRQTYATLPAAAPVSSTPTDPSFTVQAIINNIMIDLQWSASTDAQGADIKYEVESSINGGTAWVPFRGVDNLEPGKLTKLQVSTRNFFFGSVRFRIRAFNGVNYSSWVEGIDLTVTKWPSFLARSPVRGGDWYDGSTQYPGTRWGDEYGCINSDGVTYDLSVDGVPAGSRPKPNFYIAFEAPAGSKITHIHFWNLVTENSLDFVDIWVWDDNVGAWQFSSVQIGRDFSEAAAYFPSSQLGWWEEHWVELDPQGLLTDPTKVGFAFFSFEHNSWYPDQDTVGFAVDMVKITGDVPDGEEEVAEEGNGNGAGVPCPPTFSKIVGIDVIHGECDVGIDVVYPECAGVNAINPVITVVERTEPCPEP